MERIRFDRSVETAAFFSPLAGMELAEQTIEVRRDPLTGMTAVASSELATKEETFYGRTDWEYADELAQKTREGCFFCPRRSWRQRRGTPRTWSPVGVFNAGGRLCSPTCSRWRRCMP